MVAEESFHWLLLSAEARGSLPPELRLKVFLQSAFSASARAREERALS